MFLFSLALYNVKNTRSVNVPEDVGGQETEYIIVPVDLNFLTDIESTFYSSCQDLW